MADSNNVAKTKNNFNQTVNTLFNGMDAFLSSKSVVGDPITVGDTVIIPLVDVNFGVAAGAMANAQKGSNNAAGSMGGKLSPTAVLVISNGKAKMISVKESDNVSKILDMIPEVVEKVTALFKKDSDADAENEKEVKDAIDSLSDETF